MPDPMRILFVANGLPPGEKAGVQIYTAGLARRLGARHEVVVYAPAYDRDVPEFTEYEEDHGTFRAHRIVNHFSNHDLEKELYHPEIDVRFERFLRAWRPDVVHVQSLLNLSASLLARARETSAPVVLHLHDYWFVCPLYLFLQRDLRRCTFEPGAMLEKCVRCDVATAYLNRLEAPHPYGPGVLRGMVTPEAWATLEAIYEGDASAVFGAWTEPGLADFRRRRARLMAYMQRQLARADVAIAPSRHMEDVFARAGVPAERLLHLPYGIDHGRLGDVRHERKDRLRVTFLGTLTKQKGPHVLLQAFAGLPRGRARLRLYGWTGDERYAAWLRELAAGPDIEWMGPAEREDLPGIHAETDVLVVPSIWVENCPIVIREAHAARTPVVASRTGAFPEFVEEGRSGLLFETGDAADLRRVLGRLLEEPDLLESLRRGIPPVRTIDEEVSFLEDLYERLQRGQPPRGPRGDGPPEPR